ncbi:unnamed protein product [Diamesa hyperborea]
MKLFVILSALAVICLAAPIDDKVEVKSSYNEISGNSYKFGFDLTDGQTRAEEGKLVHVGDKQVLRVTGSFSFVGDDGKTYDVLYTADENGYQPTIHGRFGPEVSYIDPNLSKTLTYG